jgi:hypothetical protein
MDGCYGGACNLPGFGGQSPFLNLGPQQIGFQSFGTTSNGFAGFDSFPNLQFTSGIQGFSPFQTGGLPGGQFPF